MRTLIATLVGLAFLGMLGLPLAKADMGTSPPIASTSNIRVRLVRQQMEDNGLRLVYELQNRSLDRWILHRTEVHVFDKNSRRIELLRPVSSLRHLQRGDIDFIRTRIPAERLPEAYRLQLHLFVQEYGTFPAADPGLADLVYSFPLKPQSRPSRVVRAKPGTLRVEPAGMIEWAGGPRALLLRVTNHSTHTLARITLRGAITGTKGPLHTIRLRVNPTHLRPGAETYVSVPVPKSIIKKAKGLALQALYLTTEQGPDVTYVEDLEIGKSGGKQKKGKGRLLTTAERGSR